MSLMNPVSKIQRIFHSNKTNGLKKRNKIYIKVEKKTKIILLFFRKIVDNF